MNMPVPIQSFTLSHIQVHTRAKIGSKVRSVDKVDQDLGDGRRKLERPFDQRLQQRSQAISTVEQSHISDS